VAGIAVARADQCAGVCGVGRTKFGPTVHAAHSAAIEMMLLTVDRAELRLMYMSVIACGG
jgi:hypothetical protein